MKTTMIGATAVAVLSASAALAEEKRELGAHEHGVSVLNIAIEGDRIEMELLAPGADIVGFEYAAKTDADKAAVEKAEADLAKPLALFVPSADAGCVVASADAHLVGDESHDEHGHDDHGHEEHAEDKHDDHAHDDHAEHKHDDHGHDDHAEHKHDDDHAHDEHAHDEHDHADEASHSEFRAEYALTCSNMGALTAMTFPFFERFENAEEIEATVVSAKGQTTFEIEAGADASIDLAGAI